LDIQMANDRAQHLIFKDAATLTDLENRLAKIDTPLDFSGVHPEKLAGLRALAELIVFSWRADKALHGRLRKAGGCKAYMENELSPLLLNLSDELRKDVQVLGSVRANNPGAWRKQVISVMVKHGFPEAVVNKLLTPGEAVLIKPPTLERVHDNSDTVASPAPARKRVARPASLSRLIRRMVKRQKMSGEKEVEISQQEPLKPLRRLKQALRTQFHGSPKPARKITFKRIIDQMNIDELGKATEMCVQLNSQLADVLMLCFHRQKEIGSTAHTPNGTVT